MSNVSFISNLNEKTLNLILLNASIVILTSSLNKVDLNRFMYRYIAFWKKKWY